MIGPAYDGLIEIGNAPRQTGIGGPVFDRYHGFLPIHLEFTMHDRKTLFITGVSSGLGNALAQEALAAGHRVIGTVRSEAALQAFEALSTERAHGVILDVTEFDRIGSAVAEISGRRLRKLCSLTPTRRQHVPASERLLRNSKD
jgi:hypothetical protein